MSFLDYTCGRTDNLLLCSVASPPTVTILSRTPAGKRCWTMQLRHWPRSAGAQANDHLKPVKGPDPKSDEAIEPTILKQFWPEAADSIEPIKAYETFNIVAIGLLE